LAEIVTRKIPSSYIINYAYQCTTANNDQAVNGKDSALPLEWRQRSGYLVVAITCLRTGAVCEFQRHWQHLRIELSIFEASCGSDYGYWLALHARMWDDFNKNGTPSHKPNSEANDNN